MSKRTPVDPIIRQAFDALPEEQRSALWCCFQNGDYVDTQDVAFELAFPNARARPDCGKARGILHRLERHGAIVRHHRRTPRHPRAARRSLFRTSWRLAKKWHAVLESLESNFAGDPDGD
jgi:hypothetical protein